MKLVLALAAPAIVIRANVDRDVLPTDDGLLGGVVPPASGGESLAQTSHSTTSTPKSTPTSQFQTTTSMDTGILGLGGLFTVALAALPFFIFRTVFFTLLSGTPHVLWLTPKIFWRVGSCSIIRQRIRTCQRKDDRDYPD
ncbi:hypothetical protein FIBSPDRAFT_929790 [Athelia psychrophila]|uniref:Uncharacterized protein n=1 Tax=Athelia psychrophila TaxID=1759441 RepID=A0A166N2U3_9AGAM|nr:hypothetical protein FIBSPDRAFT_929790 [Fibularhizoctonia sp. CBS 109695]